VDYIRANENRVQNRAVVNTVMKVRIPQKSGKFHQRHFNRMWY